jgi:hypothetical protein
MEAKYEGWLRIQIGDLDQVGLPRLEAAFVAVAGRDCLGVCPHHGVMRRRHLRGVRLFRADLPGILIQMGDAKGHEWMMPKHG